MTCSILGLGTALPDETISQEESLTLSRDVICEDKRQRRLISALYRKSGVETRHIVVPWQTGYAWSQLNADSGRGAGTELRMQTYATYAPPLAATASRSAIEHAGVDAASITHLVTVSCTGFVSPGVDAHLISELGLPPTTQRVNVGFMGCHAAINGLRVARGLIAADPQATVLLAAVELCSLHYRMKWDDEAIIGNALFADGAAAVVLQQSSEQNEIASLVDTASCYIPDSLDQMSWNVGDFGFDMKLSAEIPDSICQHLRPFMEQWLGTHDLTIDQIADWVIHPGGPRILTAAQQTLGLADADLQHSREVLRTCGNMSSPTVLFILEKAMQAERSGPRVMLGFGPGLVAEVALLH
ncbi:type III polyketide synthase [Roseimaritima ulvae]|uniref:Alpha-pyrone synthesis polyketide synthase-like Pks18 n=1 Tax=Roseimaritima ulvae TaxID=980254 RepID=A0A5B9QSI3_9BACT|nr:type III polyketide synthase [Roseimaritima ulvae]QEG42018.1 Alpha-pyrone synthesis polyketide synthase-like Pks18 [Roseimaritima ulvae]